MYALRINRMPWVKLITCCAAIVAAAEISVGGGPQFNEEQCHVRTSQMRTSVLVATLVLPDGLGDVAFGESAAIEIAAAPADVTWIRVYPNEHHWEVGEALVAGTVSKLKPSYAFKTNKEFEDELLREGVLSKLWSDAAEIYLAPWIFGINHSDEAMLALARKKLRRFWVLTEYGRGVGPINGYTDGLGNRVPTGWPESTSGEGGVFKTILRGKDTGTNWKTRLAARLGLQNRAEPLRLWWAYGRRDSARVHEFRLLSSRVDDANMRAIPEVCKLVPIDKNGELATGTAQTMGELLAEQAHGLMTDSKFVANIDVKPPSETQSHVAGQLSELLVHILTRATNSQDDQTTHIIVAPNAAVDDWSGSSAVRISMLELVRPDGTRQQMRLNRAVFLVAEPVPRQEMKTFLQQCERPVVATGDQSIAEAVLLDRVPFTRPDAKVEQWQFALNAAANGTVGAVPDLGHILRRLLWSEEERARVVAASQAHSLTVQARAAAKFGEALGPTQVTLMRAGMFG